MKQQAFLHEPAPIQQGWMGTIAQFLQTPPAVWLATLSENYQRLYRQRSTQTQQQAWIDCGKILRSQLALLVKQRSDSAAWTLIFEYELPREGGRRPDLVILGAGQILVFEFKQQPTPGIADLDQVAAYGRDLTAYHGASSRNPVQPILVPTRRTKTSEVKNGVKVLHPDAIAAYLSTLTEQSPEIDPIAWVNADYLPLPTVVQAARQIFLNEPLPDIKRARSAGIPEVLMYLEQLIGKAQQQKQRHLVLITGVPGAGKTLVGLQCVYQNQALDAGKKQAVFLSGNTPLVQVLQYALKSRVFVQSIRNFYIQHEVRRQTAPSEQVLVFDEAQRAWDSDRMQDKYGIDTAASGTVLRIADRLPDWGVVVGLIGEGQQIHVGEEDGIEQWNRGLQSSAATWHVHCTPEQAEFFTAIAPDQLHQSKLLNLTLSLRSHLANDVQAWVAHVLQGEFEQAATLMPLLTEQGFDAYLTRDLDLAKTYCRDRYADQPDKRYGLLASSRARNLVQHGIPNDYLSTQRVNVGAWYIDPCNSPLSSCALETVVTEFGSQGLELDLPIVAWGSDLLWKESVWVTTTRQKQVKNPLRLRLNSYRVLLTRGRDGFVIFVPPDPKMDEVDQVLRSAGLRALG